MSKRISNRHFTLTFRGTDPADALDLLEETIRIERELLARRQARGAEDSRSNDLFDRTMRFRWAVGHGLTRERIRWAHRRPPYDTTAHDELSSLPPKGGDAPQDTNGQSQAITLDAFITELLNDETLMGQLWAVHTPGCFGDVIRDVATAMLPHRTGGAV